MAHHNSKPMQDTGAIAAQQNAAEDLPLSRKEKKDVEELRRATAVVLHEVIRKEGQRELERKFASLAFSALAAGMSMGFSLVGEGLLASMLPDVPWRPLIAKFGYSLGFLFVILGRQQLFTENTITAVIPALHNHNLRTFLRLLRMWSIVLTFNIAGALAFAAVVANSAIFSEAAKHEFARMGEAQVVNGFGTELLKAIFAGWLIAFMVWMLPSVDTSRIALITIVTYVVGLGNLAHIIAGAVEAFYGAFAGASTWHNVFFRFFLPTLLGNIIGGVTLVSALNRAQVDTEFKN
ncbi:MAG: formate/nitrite transporter family protein [Acidobacteriaceae bacterium]